MTGKEQPIEPNLKKLMNDIGNLLGGALASATKDTGLKYGFCLFMFQFGEGGFTNYISNANREDMLATLKEFIANAEGRYHEGKETRI